MVEVRPQGGSGLCDAQTASGVGLAYVPCNHLSTELCAIICCHASMFGNVNTKNMTHHTILYETHIFVAEA